MLPCADSAKANRYSRIRRTRVAAARDGPRRLFDLASQPLCLGGDWRMSRVVVGRRLHQVGYGLRGAPSPLPAKNKVQAVAPCSKSTAGISAKAKLIDGSVDGAGEGLTNGGMGTLQAGQWRDRDPRRAGGRITSEHVGRYVCTYLLGPYRSMHPHRRESSNQSGHLSSATRGHTDSASTARL